MSNVLAAKTMLSVNRRYDVVSVTKEGAIIEGALRCGAVEVVMTTHSVIVTRHLEFPQWNPCFQITESGYTYIPGPEDEPSDEGVCYFQFIPLEGSVKLELTVSEVDAMHMLIGAVIDDPVQLKYVIARFANTVGKEEISVEEALRVLQSVCDKLSPV